MQEHNFINVLAQRKCNKHTCIVCVSPILYVHDIVKWAKTQWEWDRELMRIVPKGNIALRYINREQEYKNKPHLILFYTEKNILKKNNLLLLTSKLCLSRTLTVVGCENRRISEGKQSQDGYYQSRKEDAFQTFTMPSTTKHLERILG